MPCRPLFRCKLIVIVIVTMGIDLNKDYWLKKINKILTLAHDILLFQVMEDWKYMAMVLDRLFLWLFTLACFMGSGGIILRAPSLYDMREPIDARHTTIGV